AAALRHTAAALRHTAAALRHTAAALRHTAAALRHAAAALQHTAAALQRSGAALQRGGAALQRPVPRLFSRADRHAPRRVRRETPLPNIEGKTEGDRRGEGCPTPRVAPVMFCFWSNRPD